MMPGPRLKSRAKRLAEIARVIAELEERRDALLAGGMAGTEAPSATAEEEKTVLNLGELTRD